MENKTNEKLFREIGRLQRMIRQILPPPHGGANLPPHHRRLNDLNHEIGFHPHGPDMARGAAPRPPRRERILRILLSEENGMRQKQISEMMGIGAPAMSETIDRLEEDNYIERITDPDDRRATRILLTEKGKARAYEIQDDHAESLNQLFKNLNEDEKIQLIELLQKIK